jgi:cell division protease FtsH
VAEGSTAMAATMVGSWGLAGNTPLLRLGSASDTAHLLRFEHVRAAVHDELTEASVACEKHLREHSHALAEIAARLLRDDRIEGVEVERIIGRARGVSQRDSDPEVPYAKE